MFPKGLSTSGVSRTPTPNLLRTHAACQQMTRSSCSRPTSRMPSS
ncbi:hypothetical protein LINPERPRIM_LOCUS23207 [Linum perenne]